MVKIPEKMSNEESKFVARVLVAERELAIAQGKHYGAVNALRRYYEQGENQQGRKETQ
jgi:hypothetical protein